MHVVHGGSRRLAKKAGSKSGHKKRAGHKKKRGAQVPPEDCWGLASVRTPRASLTFRARALNIVLLVWTSSDVCSVASDQLTPAINGIWAGPTMCCFDARQVIARQSIAAAPVHGPTTGRQEIGGLRPPISRNACRRSARPHIHFFFFPLAFLATFTGAYGFCALKFGSFLASSTGTKNGMTINADAGVGASAPAPRNAAAVIVAKVFRTVVPPSQLCCTQDRPQCECIVRMQRSQRVRMSRGKVSRDGVPRGMCAQRSGCSSEVQVAGMVQDQVRDQASFSTMSSRCTISARPSMPRIRRMSPDDFRMILAASAAS